jgi:hypothetical protein
LAGPTTSPSASPSATASIPAPGSNGQFTPGYYARWRNGLPSSADFFPLGVWDQDPVRQRNGVPNAVNYKRAGINTFVGLWNFPSEPASQSRLDALKANGMYALAGDENMGRPPQWSSTSALRGFQIGDEPDMSTNPTHITPTQFDAAVRKAKQNDPTRPVYNNFGKAFSLYPWIGAHEDAGGLKGYCRNLDIASSDYYAAIDGYEPDGLHTPNYYGRAVDHTRYLCGDGTKPVWGFVETGHPGSDHPRSQAPFSAAGTITASAIKQAVWSELAHGANGIIYFCHDFFSGGFTEDGLFDHPANLTAVREVNAEIRGMASILNTQRRTSGLTAVHADATLRAGTAGWYVIAAGNASGGGTASFTVSAAAGRTIRVVNENRTLTANASGTWTDTFTPWGHHVYQIG